MTVLERLRRFDDRVLGRPKPVSPRTRLSSFLVGVAGTVGALLYATFDGDTAVLAGSGGFFGVMVGGAVGWYRLRERSGDWDGRPGHRRNVLLTLVLVPSLLVAWYAALFARGDGEPQVTREQCEAIRLDFLAGESAAVLDGVLRDCAERGWL